MEVDHELRYLIAQLRIYNLHGRVPGGSEITVSPNIGIKQGAPESAEIFGLVMDSLLMRLVAHPKVEGPRETLLRAGRRTCLLPR